jgi:hypothetical protein
MKKKIAVLLAVLVLILIYNLPPILVSSGGILIGKKIPDKIPVSGEEILDVYTVTTVFSHENRWKHFYFINTNPFGTVYIEEPYLGDSNIEEKVCPFLYRIKSDSEKNTDMYKFIRNGKEFLFYFINIST